jgi:alpha-D-ribose 1-methylphosphonate 5-triphosphate synthase subunit PhnH
VQPLKGLINRRSATEPFLATKLANAKAVHQVVGTTADAVTVTAIAVITRLADRDTKPYLGPRPDSLDPKHRAGFHSGCRLFL